ncbi:MAG: YihA family ribosome biogenesis GTP-binding protein [Bacteroidales bacterium]|nr:YihA family ribosome biogenesis GTP-binding protein [Bacteroidales bacterium]
MAVLPLIKNATFVASFPSVDKCPRYGKPEVAFIGRSNVGKSSLINMLTGRNGLAKTSQKPGKTQTINYFNINNSWMLVDLPGYGYARVPKGIRQGFAQMVERYALLRNDLYCLFVLIDSRLEPQRIDLEFINWLGGNGIPFALVFTKADKLTANALAQQKQRFASAMLEQWEELPRIFTTSATSKQGRDELLGYIHEIVQQ